MTPELLAEIIKLLEDSVKDYDIRASFSPQQTIQASIEQLKQRYS